MHAVVNHSLNGQQICQQIAFTNRFDATIGASVTPQYETPAPNNIHITSSNNTAYTATRMFHQRLRFAYERHMHTFATRYEPQQVWHVDKHQHLQLTNQYIYMTKVFLNT